MNGLAIKSIYERLADMLNDVLSFTIGPSKFILLVSKPILSVPWYFFISPSLVRTSMTEERRPPKRAGKELLNKVTFLIASGVKTEKKPNIWSTLYTGVPSSKIRFWSGLPPRIYNPADPSTPACTPGINWMAFITSDSPNILGVFLICTIGISTAPICVATVPASALSETTTTSSNCAFPFIRIFSRVSWARVKWCVSVVYPK